MRSSFAFFCLVCCLVMVFACSHIAPKPGDSPESLENRVQKHWTAKTNQEWKTAYSIFCATYREQVPFSDFLKMGKSIIEHYVVGEIEKDSSGLKADVDVTFSADIQGHLMKGIVIRETWVYEQGDWYACPEIRGFKSIFE